MHVRARATWCEGRECRGGREEESDVRTVIDFQAGAALLRHSPGLRGCPEWLLLGLERAFAESLNPQPGLEAKGNLKKTKQNCKDSVHSIYSGGKTKPEQNVSGELWTMIPDSYWGHELLIICSSA